MSLKTQIREFVKGLTLFDNILFLKAAEDRDFCEEILQIILDDPVVSVIENLPQKEVLNLQGRSVVVDLLCTLGNGKTTVVEVQRTDSEDHIRRVRYDASLITANITDPGKKFSEVPDVIIIYITKFDLFNKNATKYTVRRTLIEFGDELNDGEQIIFINSFVDDGSKLARLMKVFTGNKNYQKEFPHTYDRIACFTEKEEGIDIMSTRYEEFFQEYLKKAKEDGIREGIMEGEQKGIHGAISICKRFNASYDDTLHEILRTYHLSQSDAEKYMDKYWM
ncbi:MAG: Rpn family recombination-promoting nuclease/putative transposase [Desulfovibrio sp.]|nr:Rpn family recombination-promoting nuclease/putative transposase [Desulfovibrio sp.]